MISKDKAVKNLNVDGLKVPKFDANLGSATFGKGSLAINSQEPAFNLSINGNMVTENNKLVVEGDSDEGKFGSLASTTQISSYSSLKSSR